MEGVLKLTADLIYEAALDDDLFAQLPVVIARAMDARSCVLHWRDEGGAAEILRHSAYFSDDQMADYAANFAAHDLWTEAGMGQGFVNRGWNTTDLVPQEVYERSIFYNDWIRAMGDDTFYCCGSVMSTASGHGIIGLHRGKTQADFSQKTLKQLNNHVEHLRRMFGIRAKVALFKERGDLLGSIFTSAPHAACVLTSNGRIMMVNVPGEAILQAGQSLCSKNGRLVPALEEQRHKFDQAIWAASRSGSRMASELLLTGTDGSRVMLTLTPLSNLSSGRAVLVTVEEPSKPLPKNAITEHLRQTYGLSAAEADIAYLIANGENVRDISDARNSTIATVRTQTKHILFKMGLTRQGDIVRIVVALGQTTPSAPLA